MPIIFLPILASLIGWLTNRLALEMLFLPRKPILGVQGLLPRRRVAMAEKIASIVERDLLSKEVLYKGLNREKLYNFIEENVREMIEEKMGILYPLIGEEGCRIVSQELMIHLLNNLGKKDSRLTGLLDIHGLVKKEVEGFDEQRLEKIVRDVAKKEFRTIESVGAILGFFIGLIQLLLVY